MMRKVHWQINSDKAPIVRTYCGLYDNVYVVSKDKTKLTCKHCIKYAVDKPVVQDLSIRTKLY